MMLTVPRDLVIPPSTRPYLDRVDLSVSETDAMYAGNDSHYLSCGASALGIILTSLQQSQAGVPSAILDFGAGAGRVTRWLRAAFPTSKISTCDLRPSDMEFCARTFAASTWISGIDLEALDAPQAYDLIWLGSVVTHLSAEATKKLIRKITSWCVSGGLVVLSFHGRYAFQRQSMGEYTYIESGRWGAIQNEYSSTGYGYSDYPGQNDYGISLAKPSWMAALFETMPTARLICLSERAWDGHHDVIAVQIF